jgi:hypothetical protein
MFKGFSDSSRNNEFHGFPNLNFQMNNEAYGFSGCTFWLDAAYGLNTQTDLAAVSSWQERIKNYIFLQATAGAQPRLISSDPDFNNNPSIDFFNNVRWIGLSSSGINIAKGFTIVVVYKVTTSSPNGGNVLFSDPGNLNGITVLLSGESASITGFGVYPQFSSPLLATNVKDTNPHIAVLTNNYIIIDGVLEASGFCELPSSYQNLGSGTNSARRIQGKIAEIIIYDSTINLSNCFLLSDNINQKYAIY